MKIIIEALLAAVVICSTIHKGDSAKILGFFPFPVKSHHRLIQPLLRGLAARGHEITYFAPYSLERPPATFTQITIKDIFAEMMSTANTLHPLFKDVLPIMVGMFGEKLGERVMEEKEFQKLISSEVEFDVIISSFTILHETFAPLAHRFNAHMVDLLPSGNLHRSWAVHGNPYDTSYIIDTSVAYSDHMTLWEKIHNTYNSLLHRFLLDQCYMPKYQRIADKYFRYPGWENRPSLDKLIRNISIALVNSHHSLNYPYPFSSNVKEIGGLNLELLTNQLPKDLKEFMDGATEGVIYFTLGSHVQVSTTLGEELGKVFTKVFGSLKQRVLWKWETDFPNLPSNIKISKWFPQQEILAHKNVKLFITHGGFLSLTETVYHGVPTIGIPIMGDQYKNTKHMEYFGYGLPLYLKNITVESLTWSINEILSKPSYAENVLKRSAMFRDQPQKAMDTASFWIEYVIRHNGAHHLRPAVADMPWYQQAMLDVYAALLIIVLLPIVIFYKLCRCCLSCLCRKSNKDNSNKKRKRD